ncbi:MAG: hypothetical protein IPK73_08285 [Candidatus Obscuribacter sp.]|nr:hypothetical protein [Candidatus Obscuribacter sp.]MBK9279600.1 hypothetical protein [Candidatus Obscuribacter sp.]
MKLEELNGSINVGYASNTASFTAEFMLKCSHDCTVKGPMATINKRIYQTNIRQFKTADELAAATMHLGIDVTAALGRSLSNRLAFTRLIPCNGVSLAALLETNFLTDTGKIANS